jgi:putative Mg2+ transporter-C (MgtC) family protein
VVFVLEDGLKLLLALIVGGLVGAEREYRDKSAGFRTIIFICVGAALFTILSLRFAGPSDPSRIAANIVSGVGFLGAGAIVRGAGRVTGLTTASTIWLVAALGMGIGSGHYALSCAAVLMVLLVLWLFPAVERRIGGMRDTRTYEIVCAPLPGSGFFEVLEDIEERFAGSGLDVRRHEHRKQGHDVVCVWQVSGHPLAHDRLISQFLVAETVLELRVTT